MSEMTSSERALEAWGAYDLDDPFPLFAAVRELGAVHSVTLADGHAAWLVVGYEEARAALNDPRLSKDMQAALATGGGVVAEGLPGPAFARHMLVVDPPDHTRLRRLVSAAFSVRRTEQLRPRVESVVDDLLDGIAAAGPDARVDLVASFAFPLPFTVICELLGVPEADREALGRELIALLGPTETPDEYARAKNASDLVVAMLGALVETKQRTPGDDLVSALILARDGDERLDQQELLSTIFQLIVAGHDTTTSLIGNSVVALLRPPAHLRCPALEPREDPGRGRGAPSIRRARPALHVPLHGRAGRDLGRDDPGGCPGDRVLGSRQPRPELDFATLSSSTSIARISVISRSGTASTSVSVPHSPAWRASSPSARCSDGFPSSGSRFPLASCVGATATASSCAA